MLFRFSKYRKLIVFVLDLFIISSISFVLYFFKVNEIGRNYIDLLPSLALLILCCTLSLYIFRTYDSLWRYAESKEYMALLLGGFIGYFSYVLLNSLIVKSKIPISFSLTAYSVSLLLMLFMRLIYRNYRMKSKFKSALGRIPLAIIGAGEAGIRLSEEIRNDPSSRYYTCCFLDDNIEKIGKQIHNIEVKGPIQNIRELLKCTPVKEIVMAIPSIQSETRSSILELCSSMKYRVKTLPDTLTLMQNEEKALTKSIRDVNIEELLGREAVNFENEDIKKCISGKVVMVTGGGGSIGSELCRQIAKANPKKLVIIDIYENNAYDIQQELKFLYMDSLDLKVEIASVRDEEKINLLFQRHLPNIVFHAAAHKHVPLMEECPSEAIKNNIFGTYHVVMASNRYKVEKFVLISTDKAVNPTNIMGATKRFCEMILQSMVKNSSTEYVAVRFGNVLGSNGSVIPLFKRQIEQGGPVTITDKRIIRYFMTIPEAAQLVLQAGAMANRSEVFVLDMGQPVKIYDLAEKLIRLSGYEPGVDIPILEMGLRPGEKLYEELLTQSEELITTQNHKIFIEHQNEISQSELHDKLSIIRRALDIGADEVIKKAMKKVVPTYHDPDEVNNRRVILGYGEKIAVKEKAVIVNTVMENVG